MEVAEQDDDGDAKGSPGSEVALERADSMEDHSVAMARPGRTVLPSPLATAVSLATRSTSLAIRMGAVIGGCSFEAARFTTLSSLELGRGILEGILLRAGKDLTAASRSELGRAEAESVLERSLEHLHRTMTSVVFWTTTGFRVSGAALNAVSDVSQLLVLSLDQFFGSTDSSRAIASIITLIRREFQNPATGVQGERVGVVDLVLGLCGLAYLQASCRKLVEEDYRRLKVEEIIWDVVVLDDGERVDAYAESVPDARGAGDGPTDAVAGLLDQPSPQDVLVAVGHGGLPFDKTGTGDDESDAEVTELRLKRQILESLPSDATSLAITTSVSTTKTITADIISAKPPSLSAPPGVEIVEERRLVGALPTYRVVYRVNRETVRSSVLQRAEMPDGGTVEVAAVEGMEGAGEDEVMVANDSRLHPVDRPPPVPPKLSPEEHGIMGDSHAVASSKSARVGAQDASVSSTARQQPSGERSSTADGLADPRRKKPSSEKRGRLRSALKINRGPTRSSPLFKDASGSETATPGLVLREAQDAPRPSVGDAKSRIALPSTRTTRLQVPEGKSSMTPRRRAPPPPSPPRARGKGDAEQLARASSRASYVSVHESRRDSVVSQTDTFSVRSTDHLDRPVSPMLTRTEIRAGQSLVKSRSERDMAKQEVPRSSPSPSSPRHHRRARSQVYTPSIFTLDTNESQTSLILSPFQNGHGGAGLGGQDALASLQRTGRVSGMFPDSHLVRNLARYMRFSSASYGSSFLRILGLAKTLPLLGPSDDTHRELRWFAHHTGCDAGDILLSSFVDPQGGSDSTGSTNSGVPLVHYVSLDHASRAVVLACRGTLGFEDVLADMTCDYDDLVWRGRRFQVHKGVHASARRLLYGGDGRVLLTLKQALDEFTDYGLVLCGHSLGGAVTALLGVMLSEPALAGGTSFVTSSEPHGRLLLLPPPPSASAARHMLDNNEAVAPPPARHLCLPAGRPIHVYAYGPPATMSASLRQATRGLITSVVQGNDVVPFLSLGVLHDLQAVALAFKTDNNAAKVEVRQRIWEALQTGVAGKCYKDDHWAYAALKTLRASMMSDKLLPPGEVFVVESQRVLRRDASSSTAAAADQQWGLPARRVVLRYVRDVEARFREVRFATGMLTGHSPARYEDALGRLESAVARSC